MYTIHVISKKNIKIDKPINLDYILEETDELLIIKIEDARSI